MASSSKQTDIVYFTHARTALKYGLKQLGLQPGETILLPDFICDVVLHPLQQLGLLPRFYRLDNCFAPNFENVNKLVDNSTKAIIMVHYFGQPQSIELFREFCQNRGLFLIEDNAHGHGGTMNGKSMGTFGDIGISSPRKILSGLYRGGVLYWNKQDIPPPNVDGIEMFTMKVNGWKLKLKGVMRKVPGALPMWRAIREKPKRRPKYEDPRAFRESLIKDYLIDEDALQVLDTANWETIQHERQRNYINWSSFTDERGLQPVYKELDPGANPWCFPAYAKNQSEALKWFKWGWQNGFHIFSWPALPEKTIMGNKVALQRWKKLVCFSSFKGP